MKPSRIGEICEICGRPADLVSHIGPDSYLHERRDGCLVIRERHRYCQDHYDSLMERLWTRVLPHLL